MKCAQPFCLQGFPTFVVHLSPHRCAQNFVRYYKVDFFTFLSCWIVKHILAAFSITFLKQFVKKKKRPSPPWLACEPLIVQTSSTIWPFLCLKWPEDHKNICLDSRTNSVGLHFREWVEKIRENGKNTKTENLQNGQEKYGGENAPGTCTFGAKNKRFYNFSNFSLKLLWTVI